MSKGARWFVALVGGAIVALGATAAIAAAAVVRSGSIDVDVRQDEGDRIAVRVPAALANLAIALVPARVVERCLAEAPREWVPPARDAWRQLERSPDFVLVEVTGDDARVQVTKRQRAIVVRVDADESRVAVTVPLSTVRAALAKLQVARGPARRHSAADL